MAVLAGLDPSGDMKISSLHSHYRRIIKDILKPKTKIMSDQKSNNGWKVGLGLLAGAAVGYWLNSEQGKKVRQQAAEQTNNYSQKAAEFTKEKTAVAQSKLDRAIDRAQDLLHELTTYAKETVAHTADTVETNLEKAESSLEKGIQKAKNRIKRKADELETGAKT